MTMPAADLALADALDPGRIEAYRLRLRATGFAPVPVNGNDKIPPMRGWHGLGDATDHEIRRWTWTSPGALSTGILTRRAPSLDADILDPECAEAIERFVREQYEELGVFLVSDRPLAKAGGGVPHR